MFYFQTKNFNIKGLKSLPIVKDTALIKKTISNIELKNKDFLFFNLNPNQKILLIKINKMMTPL